MTEEQIKIGGKVAELNTRLHYTRELYNDYYEKVEKYKILTELAAKEAKETREKIKELEEKYKELERAANE